MRLSNKIVAGLPLPAKGNKITYDSVVRGFGCRVTAAGNRSFILNYRCKADHRERRVTIGAYPDWDVIAARNEAKRLKRDIDLGADPIGELQAGRAAPTVADLAARFIEDYLPTRVRPSTARDYRQQIAKDILPALGRHKVASVEFADVDKMHRTISARAPTHANRAIACLSRMFSMAIKWKMCTANPCRGVERNQETKRIRYLSEAETTRLLGALDTIRDQAAANAVRLLLLTGARRGELLSARWDDVDLVAARWIKPAAATKQKTTHVVPLNAAALEILAGMKARTNSEWLFTAARSNTPRKDIDKAWNKIRDAAGLPRGRDAGKDGIRLHDLRHSFASLLASSGHSLPLIGALLGHSAPQTTARYAHLMDDPLRAATETVGAIIKGAKS